MLTFFSGEHTVNTHIDTHMRSITNFSIQLPSECSLRLPIYYFPATDMFLQ